MGESKRQAQSNNVQYVMGMAKDQGYLTLDQMIELFPETEKDVEQLDDLFYDLYSQGIRVYDNKDVAEEKRARVKETLDEKSNQGDGADLSRIPIDDAVGLYFAEMSEVPLLSHDEEVALAKQLERGKEAQRRLASNGHDTEGRARLEQLIEEGRKARESLVEANTRLVVSVAKRYRGMGMPFLDLIQAGNEGLLRAVDKFDYRRGHKFSTYATWWIRQAVTRFLSDQGRTIRLPIHLSDRIRSNTVRIWITS